MSDEHAQKTGDRIAPNSNALLCADCLEPFAVPFENGDGKTRCAACAVDRYMKMPSAEFVLTEKIFSFPGA